MLESDILAKDLISQGSGTHANQLEKVQNNPKKQFEIVKELMKKLHISHVKEVKYNNELLMRLNFLKSNQSEGYIACSKSRNIKECLENYVVINNIDKEGKVIYEVLFKFVQSRDNNAKLLDDLKEIYYFQHKLHERAQEIRDYTAEERNCRSVPEST